MMPANLIGAVSFGFCLSALLALQRFLRPRNDPAEFLGLKSEETEEAPVFVGRRQEQEKASAVPFLSRLEMEARQAGLNIPGRNFLIVAILGAGAAFTAALALTNSVHVAGVASLGGLIAPRLWLASEKRKRTEAFARQLDGGLFIAASAIRAGASLAQAIEQVSRDGAEPLASEFAQADRAIKLGADPSAALAAMKDRVLCPDMDLAIVATQILTRTGGNLAECYERIAEAVRARRAFRQAVRAYTTVARMSGGVVSLVPVGVTLLVRTINPNYFDPMLRSPIGRFVFAGSFGLIVLGWFVTRRMLDVDLE